MRGTNSSGNQRCHHYMKPTQGSPHLCNTIANLCCKYKHCCLSLVVDYNLTFQNAEEHLSNFPAVWIWWTPKVWIVHHILSCKSNEASHGVNFVEHLEVSSTASTQNYLTFGMLKAFEVWILLMFIPCSNLIAMKQMKSVSLLAF